MEGLVTELQKKYLLWLTNVLHHHHPYIPSVMWERQALGAKSQIV